MLQKLAEVRGSPCPRAVSSDCFSDGDTKRGEAVQDGRTVHELHKPMQGSVAKGALRFGNLKLFSRIASSVQMIAEPIQQVSDILAALLLIPVACCWGKKCINMTGYWATCFH